MFGEPYMAGNRKEPGNEIHGKFEIWREILTWFYHIRNGWKCDYVPRKMYFFRSWSHIYFLQSHGDLFILWEEVSYYKNIIFRKCVKIYVWLQKASLVQRMLWWMIDGTSNLALAANWKYLKLLHYYPIDINHGHHVLIVLVYKNWKKKSQLTLYWQKESIQPKCQCSSHMHVQFGKNVSCRVTSKKHHPVMIFFFF